MRIVNVQHDLYSILWHQFSTSTLNLHSGQLLPSAVHASADRAENLVLVHPVCDFDAGQERGSGAHLLGTALDDVLGLRPQPVQRLCVDPRSPRPRFILWDPLQNDGLRKQNKLLQALKYPLRPQKG